MVYTLWFTDRVKALFRNKPFNIALLISLSWHLLCMLCITIVVLPANFQMSKTSTVSFLGPILEKTAFEMMLPKKSPSRHPLYRKHMHVDDSLLASTRTGVEKVRFESFFTQDKRKGLRVSAKDLFGQFKFIPPFRRTGVDVQQRGTRTRQDAWQKDIFIEGPLADQEILFKPELPAIAQQLDRGQDSFSVELRFKVIPDGTVDDVSLLASSGYPDIDLVAISYIKGFRFSPLASGRKPKRPVWSNVKLNLEAQ